MTSEHLVERLGSATLKSCCAQLYELPITRVLLGTSFHPGGLALTHRLANATVVGRTRRVLDVASGTGDSALELARHFGCHVTGVDLSGANVARAAERARAEGLAERCQFVVGDAESLPFDAGTFDVVLCECALCTFPDMPAALSEMRRVLVPRGRVGLSDIVVEHPPPPTLATVLGNELCIAGARTRAGYERALDDAGFATIRHRDVSRVLIDMVDRVEGRLGKARVMAEAGQLSLPDGFEAEARPTLAAARAFLASKGAGYALFTARVPDP
ncbi:MAG: methyltransferase domain-containing protein [Polyangiaceae bacterium]